MVDESAIRGTYRAITLALIARGLTVTTMESCTSGLVASLITDTEGASAALKGAFITYSNEAKVKQGVPASVIERHGVYSPQTAAAMARACRSAYGADIGVGVTGTMGNADPANGDSVPGQAFFAIDRGGEVKAFSLTLAPEACRYAYKLAVAGEIGKKLMEVVSGGGK